MTPHACNPSALETETGSQAGQPIQIIKSQVQKRLGFEAHDGWMVRNNPKANLWCTHGLGHTRRVRGGG